MLTGQTALIVEGEFLIALDIQRMLETLGVGQTLFARTSAEAEQLRARWTEIGIAIVEIRTGNAPAFALAESLVAASIPVVLITADIDAHHGFAATLDLPVVVKPIPDEDMAAAVAQALGNAGPRKSGWLWSPVRKPHRARNPPRR